MPIICSFFGHREISQNIEPELYTEIERHITEKNVDTFYTGGYGAFDFMTEKILNDIKKQFPHISVYRILAYVPAVTDMKNNQKQPLTIYPEGLELVPKRFAITYRNRWMVEWSDYIIGYTANNYGGAYDALKYAGHNKKIITNLTSLCIF